ncbi:hypothetical protein WOLCODRAFT_136485 [Wolfiporia cocos MD-104 SS10]|uniref:MATH domain-containing protein n=1 Tax=Wolfiporia cocos (strain MD-104) TaxID=742152 RepID=A0A2H3JCZ1_WOLCO|nr:hypothetical protein WOLCODRAFT_136485 [Wolfiporia cocos MD-104 SS10]
MDATEYQENTTNRLEWTVRGLKNLFESSKGDAKSKVTKSAKFGDSRWQILFYANSGTPNAEGQPCVSLYLSCEPTDEEKANAVDGKWVREGTYSFEFALHSPSKIITFTRREAHDHSFSYKTQNWGWAQFARRELVYYLQHSVKQQDAFIITCSITSTMAAVAPPLTNPRRSVPKDLMDTMGDLLNDPLYSDVEFVVPGRGKNSGMKRIYASRRVLRRVEYFDMMFRSGFQEAFTTPQPLPNMNASAPTDATMSQDMQSECGHNDDSDDEDEDEMALLPDNDGDIVKRTSEVTESTQQSLNETLARTPSVETLASSASWQPLPGLAQLRNDDNDDTQSAAEGQRNVRAKLSHPSSPRSIEAALGQQTDTVQEVTANPEPAVPGPKKVRIVMHDVAYTTFLAVLYYIYTDTMAFAPLSSSFLASSANASLPNETASSSPMAASEGPTYNQRPAMQQSDSSVSIAPRSRREWLVQWASVNGPGKPRPCSAKAVYRFADRLDLQELKERAFGFIVKSLTVDNVTYEVFSSFSAAFEEVRKVQVRYFLDNWIAIRGSDAMRDVWRQIRLGRHPGFEEVWPVIAQNLEFKAPAETSGGDGRDRRAS